MTWPLLSCGGSHDLAIVIMWGSLDFDSVLQYECSSSGVTIFLLGTPFSCSTEGEEVCLCLSRCLVSFMVSLIPVQLIVDFEASGSQYQGSIICPPLAQICHVRNCSVLIPSNHFTSCSSSIQSQNVTQPTVSPGPMPTASPTGSTSTSPGPMPTASPTGSTSMPTGPTGGTTVNTPMSSVSHLLPNVALIVVALYCTTMACTLDRVC